MKRTRRHVTSKLIAFVLSVLTLFYAIPAIVYAEAIDAIGSLAAESDSVPDGEATAADYDAPIYEVKSLREEAVKHFRLPDGSYVAAQYQYPVHYEDENGVMQDIDNSLYVGSGGVYTNENSRIKFAKKITGNQELFALHDGNTKMTLALIGAKKGTVGVVYNNEEVESSDELQKMMLVENISASIVYPEILDGVDVEYVVYSNNVKENIIVKEKGEAYSYSFELKLNGLSAELLENGDVEIINEKTGKVQYVIPSPVVYDANGTYADSEYASYTLETKNQSGAYTLAVTVSSEWMNDSERAFPVVVDPAVFSSNSTVQDTTIFSSNPTASYGNVTTIDIFTDSSHAYWKTTSLPYLPASAYITNAGVTMRSGWTDADYVAAYEVLTDWNESLTWNQHVSTTSPKGKLGTTVIDYNLLEIGFYTWNVTSLIEKWYSGTNYGIALKTPPGVTAGVSIYSSEHDNNEIRPYLTVSYVDMKGVESYLSYSSHHAGVAGSGNVNMATGQLTLAIPTLSTTDSLMPYTPTLVYNSALSGKIYNYYNAETANTNNYMPYGFKLNVCESVLGYAFTDNIGESHDYYVYSDADGTEHAFFVSESDSSVFVDENGLQKTLRINSSGNIEITDDTKQTRVFTKKTSDSTIGSFAWYLTKIIDKNGNEIIFTYDSALKPTQISVKPNGLSKIDFLNLYYYSTGKLRMIYNGASKDAVVFRYSSTYNGAVSTTSQNYLRQIDYAHGNGSVTLSNWESFAASETNKTNITVDATASYEYNSTGYMTYAIDNLAGQKFNYSWTSKKVTALRQYSGSTLGQCEEYSYGVGYTDVKNTGNDDKLSTTDDIFTRHVFDTSGRSKSIYSYAKNGTEIYSAVTGKYETQENVKNNLKERTDFGGNSVNYLLNGDFEDTSSATSFSHWTVSGSVRRVDGSYYFDGEGYYSVRFEPTAGATASITQYVSLKSGKYTLSMPYEAKYSDGVTGLVSISSTAGSGLVHSERISLSQNGSNAINAVFSTSFTVPNHTGGGDKLKITIQFTAASSVTSAPIIEVDRVMLENSIGASPFSLVSYGSFDASGLNSAGSATALSTYWKTQSSSSPATVTGDTHFGTSAKVTGQIDAARYVKQRAYQISDEELKNYEWYGSSYANVGEEYVISGFALAENAVHSPNAAFRIRVDVIYHQRGTAEEVTVSHYFDFLPSCKGWQFTGGSFSTVYVPEDDDYSDYSCVKAIDIYCEYSNQAQGYALFDNISLVNSTDTDVEKYYYYSSGTSDGLLAYKENLFYTEYYEYDANRNLSRVANNRGEITDYYYDAKNRVVRIITSDFTYNFHTDYPFFASNPDSVITRTPKTSTRYIYNNYGMLTSESTCKVNNNEIRDTSVNEFISTYEYNVTAGSKIFGSLKSETSGIGITTLYFYDEKDGKLLAALNLQEKSGICYTYDAMDNLVSVMPADYQAEAESYGEITTAENVSYAYNSNNLLSTITTESTVYSFTYDKFGNPTSVKAGDNSVASYTYNDRNGKLKKVTYGNGFSVEYVYCDIELLKEIWYNYSDGTRELAYEYEYTADGQVYKFTDNANSRTAIYKYDSNKRLVGFAEYDNGDFYHDFSANVFYNDKGELSSAYYKLNNLSGEAISAGEYFYFYKGDGRLSSAQIDTDTTRGDEEYSYDHYNRVSSITTSHALRSNTSSTFDTKVDYTFEEGAFTTSYWVEDYVSTVNGNSITYNYTYDCKGNITEIVYSTGKKIRYAYDDVGQLISENNSLIGKGYIYLYDNAGNITSKLTYDLTEEGTRGNLLSTQNYVYATSGWKDMLTSFGGAAITYDTIGNPTSYYTGQVFSWNGRELAGVVDGSNTYSFTYNDAGIRTSKTKNGVTTTYYLNGSQIMAEETNGNITIYVYDASGTPIGMQYHGANYSANTWDTYWYEKNLFGDIVAVYNHSGTKLVSYVYDAWGNFTTTYHNGTASTSVVAKNPFKYRGYYYDADLGLYYLQTRYYDSNTGRFINADGVGYLGANGDINSYNLYAYCSNNPIMFVDPTGHGIDFVLDILFIGYDIYKLATDEGYKEWENWAELGVDIFFAAIPCATNGGKIVKLADVGDTLHDISKVTVIGETMARVRVVSQFVNATDNLYDGFKSYKKLSSLGKGGKVLAEVGGKASNIMWLYGKVRSGYTVVDIGIDASRIARSSSYIAEKVFLGVWKYRNVWKFSYHYDK